MLVAEIAGCAAGIQLSRRAAYVPGNVSLLGPAAQPSGSQPSQEVPKTATIPAASLVSV